MPKYRKIYRFEQDDKNGCWYNHDQTFNNKYGKEVEDVPMPRDERNPLYRAGCFSLKDLFTWGNVDALRKMKARVIVVLSNDYEILPKGEVIYNSTNVKYKKVLADYGGEM